ncbi:MAG TPA: methionine biosynthesis protein MetW [Chloroflexota bacterium]|nr:methionine biosynthesis protein MetW [Chloroflexota bacterium]
MEIPVLSDRFDLKLICNLVEPGSSVLDLGCGDGDLMAMLVNERGVTARGVEISEDGVYRSIARGLSVHHGDLDEGIEDYPDSSFDYVILSQTLQAVHKPRLVLQEMLRVGKIGIVSFPNFAFWQARLNLALQGRMPKTDDLPYEWYNTPNIHLTTIQDFLDLCQTEGMEVVKRVFLSGNHHVRLFPNVRARTALFMVRKKNL